MRLNVILVSLAFFAGLKASSGDVGVWETEGVHSTRAEEGVVETPLLRREPSFHRESTDVEDGEIPETNAVNELPGADGSFGRQVEDGVAGMKAGFLEGSSTENPNAVASSSTSTVELVSQLTRLMFSLFDAMDHFEVSSAVEDNELIPQEQPQGSFFSILMKPVVHITNIFEWPGTPVISNDLVLSDDARENIDDDWGEYDDVLRKDDADSGDDGAWIFDYLSIAPRAPRPFQLL